MEHPILPSGVTDNGDGSFKLCGKPPGCCPSARPLPGGGVLLTEEKDGRVHEIELTPEAVQAIANLPR